MNDGADRIAIRDQGVAEAADTCAALWKRLVHQSVSEEAATQITVAWLVTAMNTAEGTDA